MILDLCMDLDTSFLCRKWSYFFLLLSAQEQMKYHFLSRLYSFNLNRNLLDLQMLFLLFSFGHLGRMKEYLL